MENKIDTFKKTFISLKLSHHPYYRMKKYLDWCFRRVDFTGKNVLDIGGGNGIYSYYSIACGAKKAVNLEPFASGSTFFENNKQDNILQIETINKTIQEFETKDKFDVIILHDSINHLDEHLFSEIHLNKEYFNQYQNLIRKILTLLNRKGTVVITDCGRSNFWGDLGLSNPFAPSIDWRLHQNPKLVLKLFDKNDFDFNLRWSPFKRFGVIGKFISFFGEKPSYFLQSHYNLHLNFK